MSMCQGPAGARGLEGPGTIVSRNTYRRNYEWVWVLDGRAGASAGSRGAVEGGQWLPGINETRTMVRAIPSGAGAGGEDTVPGGRTDLREGAQV